MWVRNIYGQVFRCEGDYSGYVILAPENAKGEKDSFNNTLFVQNGIIFVLSHVGLFKWDKAGKKLVEVADRSLWSSDIQYPQFVYPEPGKRVWGTNNDGKNLHIYTKNKGWRR